MGKETFWLWHCELSTSAKDSIHSLAFVVVVACCLPDCLFVPLSVCCVCVWSMTCWPIASRVQVEWSREFPRYPGLRRQDARSAGESMPTARRISKWRTDVTRPDSGERREKKIALFTSIELRMAWEGETTRVVVEIWTSNNLHNLASNNLHTFVTVFSSSNKQQMLDTKVSLQNAVKRNAKNKKIYLNTKCTSLKSKKV